MTMEQVLDIAYGFALLGLYVALTIAAITAYWILVLFCGWLVQTRRMGLLWGMLFGCAFGLGLCVGFHFYDHVRQISDIRKICGFPIAMAIFQLEDGNWTDYVSSFTPFIAVLDIILLSAFPLLLFAAGASITTAANQALQRTPLRGSADG